MITCLYRFHDRDTFLISDTFIYHINATPQRYRDYDTGKVIFTPRSHRRELFLLLRNAGFAHWLWLTFYNIILA